MSVMGDPRAIELAGIESMPELPRIHLGEPAEEVVEGDVVWLPGPAPPERPAGARVIATAGDGLWSRAPWPARDELFQLPPPATPHALVVGDDGLRSEVLETLTSRGLPVTAVPLLTVDELARASVVALLDGLGAAPAVLAARRILVAPRTATTFGLLPGTDHLAFGTGYDAVQYLDAVLSFPLSFEPFAVHGAVAAERHRASLVYVRLAAELAAADRAAYPDARAD
jgi:hypothetical protein